MKKCYTYIIIIAFFSFSGLNNIVAQPPPSDVKVSNSKVIIEGNVYFIHVVKPGQTLYSISRAYKVREKDIAIENPGVYSGLQIGQVLKIPVNVPKFDQDQSAAGPPDTIKFIPHYLKAGETIYGLSRKYNLPVSQIEDANPDLDYSDLSIGQLILIPRLSITKEEENFILHKVRRKETLYSLSKQYKVDESLILKFNPDLSMKGLKAGNTIRIPNPEVALAEQAEEKIETPEIDTIEAYLNEFLEEEMEPLEMGDYMDLMTDINRRNIKVSYLIPFDYYDEFKLSDSMLNDSPETDENEEIKKNLPRSVNFLEFFEGSLLALNQLRSEGYTLEVNYFDTRKSPSRTREILSSDRFRSTNLIIGPFYPYNVEIVSEYCRENGIPVVLPFYENSGLTEKNPFIFQLTPGYKIEYRTAAMILAKEYEKNFIFVYSADSMKLPEVDYFKTSLLNSVSAYIHEENFVIREIVYDNAAKADLSVDLKLALSKDKTNIVVIPETNQAFVSNLITQLYFQLREFDIEVFGMPNFVQFSNIDYRYFHDLKLRFISPYYFSYKDPKITNFLESYRKIYGSEPEMSTRKGYQYSFAGYDISYYFIKLMADNGKRFVRHLNDEITDELLIPYRWKRPSNFGGFENHHLTLVEFGENFSFNIRDVSMLPFQRIELRSPWYFRFDD